jgi:hypothetical protein
MRPGRLVMAVGLLLGLASGASAGPMNWSLVGGASPVTGLMGNERRFIADDGVSVMRATAWARLGHDGATSISAAYLGYYSHGLGVTNANESGSGASHTMDNTTDIDLIMFAFDDPIDVSTLTLTPFGRNDTSRDSDISAWVGEVNDPMALSLAGLTLAQLDESFTRLRNNTTTISTAREALFNPGGVVGNIVIVAAVLTNDMHTDHIKIGGVAGEPVAVPVAPLASMFAAETMSAGGLSAGDAAVSEPAALALFAVALMAFAVLARRRLALHRGGEAGARAPHP